MRLCDFQTTSRSTLSCQRMARPPLLPLAATKVKFLKFKVLQILLLLFSFGLISDRKRMEGWQLRKNDFRIKTIISFLIHDSSKIVLTSEYKMYVELKKYFRVAYFYSPLRTFLYEIFRTVQYTGATSVHIPNFIFVPNNYTPNKTTDGRLLKSLLGKIR